MIEKDDFCTIQIRTLDSDVVVILIAFMPYFMYLNSSLRIHIDFGKGEHRRIISVKKSVESLGHEFSRALLFIHSFSGCDSTCSFYSKSKITWLKQLDAYPNKESILQVFQQLSWTPEYDLISRKMDDIESFVTYCYGYPQLQSVDETRYQIFCSSVSGDLRQLPPSKNSLKLHVSRSCFQAGWVWGNTIAQKPCPPATEWGWSLGCDETEFCIEWYNGHMDYDSSDSMTLAKLVTTYNCKKSTAMCKNCNSSKVEFPCLKFCNCGQACTDILK